MELQRITFSEKIYNANKHFKALVKNVEALQGTKLLLTTKTARTFTAELVSGDEVSFMMSSNFMGNRKNFYIDDIVKLEEEKIIRIYILEAYSDISDAFMPKGYDILK